MRVTHDASSANVLQRTATIDVYTDWFYDDADAALLLPFSQVNMDRHSVTGAAVVDTTNVANLVCDLQTSVSEQLGAWGWAQIDISR